SDIRTQLYRLLPPQVTQLHESMASDSASSTQADTAEAIAAARLRQLPSLARQALSPAALEGFSETDIAAIIERDIADVQILLNDATAEIDRQTRARILIIEDEPIIAMDIEMIVRDLGHDVVAVATTHAEAVDEAKRHRPS